MNGLIKFITMNRVSGITLAPFGIYIDKQYVNHQTIVNHEKIHWKQQIEMGVVFFYLWYIIEWFIRLFTNNGNAYKSISFEQECYENDNNLYYLSNRKHYSWIKYFK